MFNKTSFMVVGNVNFNDEVYSLNTSASARKRALAR